MDGVSGWLDEWMEGWMRGEWVVEWKDGWMGRKQVWVDGSERLSYCLVDFL